MSRRVGSIDRMHAARRSRDLPLRSGRVVLGMLASLLVLSAGAAVLLAGVASGRPVGTRLVPGLLPGLSRATRLGTAPARRQLSIGVGITRPDVAGEVRLFDELYDPGSPEYHHFLTVRQFQRSFGVRPATTAAVRSWLTGGGLRITTSSAGGDLFTATGTVAQLDRLFHVRIGAYAYKGTRFLANDVAPSVPANLPIDAVSGLETLSHFTLDSLTGRQLARLKREEAAIAAGRLIVKRDATHPAIGVPTQSGDEQIYTPQDLWGVYDDPGAKALTESSGLSDPTTLEDSKTTLGQGQTIGVFGEGETSSVVRQLRLFETALGLPKVPVRTIETEGAPDSAYSDNSGAIEWYLDSQSSTGMAPDVKQLDFYFAKGFEDADIAKDFDYWANDPEGPREMNASFGECEQNPSEPITGPLGNYPVGVGLGGEAEALSDPGLRQAALEGRTLFTSAGDTGSGCPEIYAPVLGGGNGLVVQPVPAQNYPCVSDYAVCVGGTVVSSTGDSYPTAADRSAETSWTFSGGGNSYFNPAPDYQKGVSAVDKYCVSNDTGTKTYPPNTVLCRGVPDVADLSGNVIDDGYFIYIDGEPSEEGGTSLSSPLMMGQWARVQAAAPAKVQAAGGLGFADPTIYHQAQDADKCTTAGCPGDTTYDRDFFDITQSEFGAGNGENRPGPGWDYASGWGALNVANFTQDVDGTTDTPNAYTGQERPAANMCTVTMTSPTGNATDPVTDEGNDPGIDMTQATLTSSGSTVTATVTVPDLKDGPPAESSGGASYYVAWEYDGTVYYATANEAEGGSSFTYSSGNTGKPYVDGAPQFGSYTNTPDSAATGSADTSTGVITIHIPASEVGSPPAGTALTDPQSFVQIDVGPPTIDTVEALTADSSDTLRPYSIDDGELDSIGENVVFDGVAGTNCATKPPVTKKPPKPKTPPPVCTQSNVLATHIRAKHITRRGVALRGIAIAHCGDYITRVGVAIAKEKGSAKHERCSFLSAKHRFGRYGSCKPRDYLKAKGTETWSFSLKLHFGPAVYFLWEHATDSRHHTTHNTAGRHVFFRFG